MRGSHSISYPKGHSVLTWCIIAGMALASLASVVGAPTDRQEEARLDKAAEKILPPKDLQALAQAIEPGIPCAGKFRSRGREVYRFAGNRWTIGVDAADERVISARYSVPSDQTKPTPAARAIGLQKAENKLRSWLDVHNIDLSDWIVTGREQVDEGEAGVHYTFQWLRRSPEGVYLPACARATVAGDGTVEGMGWVDYPVSIPLTPKISRPDAMAKAIAASGLKSSRIISVRLQVWYYASGSSSRLQVLRYEIDMCGVSGRGGSDTGQQRTIYLDANTGDVLLAPAPIWQ